MMWSTFGRAGMTEWVILPVPMSQENVRWLGVGVVGVLGFLAIAYAVLELAPDLFADTEGLDARLDSALTGQPRSP